MLKRFISLKTFRPLIASLIFLALATNQANAQSLDATHYKPLAKEFKVSTGDKIEVAELFWFGCGGCYALEPPLKQWKANKPENAEFVKIPAIFSSKWEFHGKAFYTMQSLNVPDVAYDEFFNNIHVRRNPMNSFDRLVKFLAPYNFTEEQVSSAFNSFEVDSKLRMAKKISRQSGATSVPTLIVDGKYMTNGKLASDKLFEVVDQLVEKAASER